MRRVVLPGPVLIADCQHRFADSPRLLRWRAPPLLCPSGAGAHLAALLSRNRGSRSEGVSRRLRKGRCFCNWAIVTTKSGSSAAVELSPRFEIVPTTVSASSRLDRRGCRPIDKVKLPIQAILDEFIEKLCYNKNVVLQAPPGAGKTTLAPLAVLKAGFVDGVILILQPRRIACVNAAKRLAHLSGEPLGQTVGYRMRHDALVCKSTRIEVVTEGILVQMLHNNPSLEGVGCIFFDEFHERNMDSDLSFALCRHAQQSTNMKLRLVVMSATFFGLGYQLARVLGDCPMIVGEGRCFPVQVQHRGSWGYTCSDEGWSKQRMERLVAETVREALVAHPGDVLVFLPGEREIMYVWIFLNNLGIGDGKIPKRLIGWARKLIDQNAVDVSRRIEVTPLYGFLEQIEQEEVLRLSRPGWRKVILASPIAESSLTLPEVRIVIDSGLRRVKVSEPSTCMSFMQTERISGASADQRRGRAGRVSTGVCYRLWNDEEHLLMDENDTPEIIREDVASVVLDLALAGHCSNESIGMLPWVDPPTERALDHARRLLVRLGALEVVSSVEGLTWRLTNRGRQMARMPLHPRLAHMILQAKGTGSDRFARDACELAALLEENEILRGGRVQHGVDIFARMIALHSADDSSVVDAVRIRVLQAAQQLQSLLDLRELSTCPNVVNELDQSSIAALVAWAYPELLARAEGRSPGELGRSHGNFRMFNGHVAKLDRNDTLSAKPSLAIAALAGSKPFWAVAASVADLGSYGIDISDPVRHEVFDGVATAVASTAGAARTATPTRLCPAFSQGKRCYAGDACRYAHGVEELAASMSRSPESFRWRDVLSMLWDVGLAKPRLLDHDRLVALLARHAAERAECAEAAELSLAACAVASAGACARGAETDAFFQVVGDLLERQGVAALALDGQGGNASALLWAFTEAGYAHERLFDALAKRAVEALRGFSPRVLSDAREVCFWSFHRASLRSWSNRERGQSCRTGLHNDGFAHPDFFATLSRVFVESVHEFNPIAVVYVMWTYCKASVCNLALFDAVASRVVPVADSLDRCALAMLSWSFAYAGIERPHVLLAVVEDALRPNRLTGMAPRDVANISWALARSRCEHKLYFETMAEHTCGLLADCIEQQCYRETNKSLKRSIYRDDHSARDGAVDAWDVLALADLLWSFAELRVRAPKLFEQSGDYMILGLRQRQDSVERFVRSPSHIVKALVAYVDQGVEHEELFRAAAPYLLQKRSMLKPSALSSLGRAWAAACPSGAGPCEELRLLLLETARPVQKNCSERSSSRVAQ